MVRGICWRKGNSQRRRYKNGLVLTLRVLMEGRHWLSNRYTNDKEKIRGTRAITPPPSTECRNSRNSSHHPSGYPTNGWTGKSPLSLVSFTFIQLSVYKAQAAGTRPNISQIPAKLRNDSAFLTLPFMAMSMRGLILSNWSPQDE